MTGEITLRGRVLPVGGLKEKYLQPTEQVLIQLSYLLTTKDVDDIPESVRKDLKFVYVSHMDTVLSVALAKPSNVRICAKTPIMMITG